MRWPWRRFEEFFQRHLLRKGKDVLERQRDLMLAAVQANTNFDTQENAKAKQQRIEQIEESFKAGVEFLYAKDTKDVEAANPYTYENDPLFRSVRRQAEDLRAGAQRPQVEQAGRGREMLDAMVTGDLS